MYNNRSKYLTGIYITFHIDSIILKYIFIVLLLINL